MKKSTSIGLIIAAAAASAAAYYLFSNEKGINLRKRLVKDATNALDGLLENLENQLAEAEGTAREKMAGVREEVRNY